jgi:hypothetical protein
LTGSYMTVVILESSSILLSLLESLYQPNALARYKFLSKPQKKNQKPRTRLVDP